LFYCSPPFAFSDQQHTAAILASGLCGSGDEVWTIAKQEIRTSIADTGMKTMVLTPAAEFSRQSTFLIPNRQLILINFPLPYHCLTL
jgi:hypothetical protein